ncbi:hypothetical protein THIOM_003425 [Candidatus Thiomargarita nelsonii]|uniref:Uncharacterized protein n=1 Tax=Candidatus Thiomargarita nelsonii TaxID=1003181 RepID=A0A176RYT1_9GAMM|nr:hypothetical protein THIOM_003425 [Candidatus Thiomargarita nelsonii]
MKPEIDSFLIISHKSPASNSPATQICFNLDMRFCNPASTNILSCCGVQSKISM